MPSNVTRMRVLMEDPVFRAYMKRVPPTVHALTSGEPWQLWVNRGQGAWATKTYASYREVWSAFVPRFRADYDVTITSRRLFYAPPGEWYKVKVRGQRRPTPGDPSTTQLKIETRWRQTFHWPEMDLHWCGRCRRPVYWMPLFSNHHALRRMPAVTDDDNYRCVICGIRWVAQPDVSNMVKMEVPA